MTVILQICRRKETNSLRLFKCSLLASRSELTDCLTKCNVEDYLLRSLSLI
uniref:Uncharacterized protein n=1 Tax=Anguilla anguilla TaxID=7936 RepID=A0A0E9V497_ANGAN